MNVSSASDNPLAGRRALITGASRGVGAAVARAVAEGGARAGLLSRSGDDLGLPGAVGVRCDISDRANVFAAVEEVAGMVVFCVTRPPGMRILTMSSRPMIEGSWG